MRRIARIARRPCPLEGTGVAPEPCGHVPHYELDGGGLSVAECATHGFVWYQKR